MYMNTHEPRIPPHHCPTHHRQSINQRINPPPARPSPAITPHRPPAHRAVIAITQDVAAAPDTRPQALVEGGHRLPDLPGQL